MDDKFDEIENIGAHEIQQYQQNRYPLFFLDVCEEIIPGKYVKAKKNFTYNEWYFPAHFADEPNVPGFIQLEILAQTFIMTFLTIPEYKGKKTAFLDVENLCMRKKIVPGDTLIAEAFLEKFRRGIAEGYVTATVNGEKALSVRLRIGVPDIVKMYTPPEKVKALYTRHVQFDLFLCFLLFYVSQLQVQKINLTNFKDHGGY